MENSQNQQKLVKCRKPIKLDANGLPVGWAEIEITEETISKIEAAQKMAAQDHSFVLKRHYKLVSRIKEGEQVSILSYDAALSENEELKRQLEAMKASLVKTQELEESETITRRKPGPKPKTEEVNNG